MESPTVEVFIEIPKGDGRRRHLSRDKKQMLDLGPINDMILINDGLMPEAYGFIIGAMQKEESYKNPMEVPDEIDIIVFSEKAYKPGDIVHAIPIGIMLREDGDHKVLSVDETTIQKIKGWADVPEPERELFTRYFGHRAKIERVGDAAEAADYISKNRI